MTNSPVVPVLVVDDDKAIRDIVRNVLQEADYPVFEASDGMDAVAFLRGSGLRMVVISDHMMPRLDGPGLFEYVQNDPTLAGRHQFIYLTAADRIITPSVSAYLSAHDARVIRKPFDVDALLNAVNRAARQLSLDVEGIGVSAANEADT